MGQQAKLSLYRECRPVVDAQCELGDGASVTAAIATALADAVGIDPLDLPPLHDYVNTDLVDAMVGRTGRRAGNETVLSFQVDTWNVFVRSDGRIRVCDGTQETDPEPVFESALV